MAREFVLGSRGSALALSQTQGVLALLRHAHPEVAYRVRTIQTAADREPATAFGRLPGVGFFVKELEVALLEERIDAAVHSMKDLPTELTPALVIEAVPAREDPRDVLVARDRLTLRGLPPGARIGTSSPRRMAYLRAARPDVQVVPVRGNVDTRIGKVDRGELDAVCLAAAGLQRLGLEGRITERLAVATMLPAPGQGALGVQVRATDERSRGVVRSADHRSTRQAVVAERAVLRRLQGGCRLPMGAHAVAEGDRLSLQAAVIAPDGAAVIEAEATGSAAEAEELGRDLADELLARGAASLIPAADGAQQ